MVDVGYDREISNILHFINNNNKNNIILRPWNTTRKRIRRLLKTKRFCDFENMVLRPNTKIITVVPREMKNKLSKLLCINSKKKNSVIIIKQNMKFIKATDSISNYIIYFLIFLIVIC